MGRKSNAIVKAQTLDKTAQKFADLFIASKGIKGAEKLAIRITEKIRASNERLREKYGS